MASLFGSYSLYHSDPGLTPPPGKLNITDDQLLYTYQETGDRIMGTQGSCTVRKANFAQPPKKQNQCWQ